MTSQVRLIDKSDLQWEEIPGAVGGVAQIGEVISGEHSDTIGAGFTRLENTTMSREVAYDETVFVVEGTMAVESGGETLIARQGQALHIPKGSVTRYTFVEPTLLFYAIYPNNWAELIS